MSKFNDWSKKEYELHSRIITTLSAGIIFLFLIPFVILHYGPLLDAYFGLQIIHMESYHAIFILLICIPGFCLAIWSIITQIIIGRGTPLPVMATQKLLHYRSVQVFTQSDESGCCSYVSGIKPVRRIFFFYWDGLLFIYHAAYLSKKDRRRNDRTLWKRISGVQGIYTIYHSKNNPFL